MDLLERPAGQLPVTPIITAPLKAFTRFSPSVMSPLLTNRSRKRAGTGSNPPPGRGGSRVVERRVGNGTEGGRRCALLPRDWRKERDFWRDEKRDEKFTFNGWSVCILFFPLLSKRDDLALGGLSQITCNTGMARMQAPSVLHSCNHTLAAPGAPIVDSQMGPAPQPRRKGQRPSAASAWKPYPAPSAPTERTRASSVGLRYNHNVNNNIGGDSC